MRSFRGFMMRVLIEMLIKKRQKIKCGIGAEEDDSAAYFRFTLHTQIIYYKLRNNRKRLRLLLMM